jgi:hypothetical protein
MGVLWSAIGASPAYEVFGGCAELLGGILLVIPRTTLLGAMICLADLAQVFTLNMTYDVPVKLFSFHLVLLSLFLIAPDLPRLTNLLLLNRPIGPSSQPSLFATPHANRLGTALQIFLGMWLVAANAYVSWHGWHAWSTGHPRSPLYGIWNVEQVSVDGQIRPPLLTDTERWRRVIFDYVASVSVQRMDDSFVGGSFSDSVSYGAAIDVNARTIALTKPDEKSWKANFSFDRPAQDRLVLDGQMDGRTVRMELTLLNRDKLLLVNRGFHWTNESAFNY